MYGEIVVQSYDEMFTLTPGSSKEFYSNKNLDIIVNIKTKIEISIYE